MKEDEVKEIIREFYEALDFKLTPAIVIRKSILGNVKKVYLITNCPGVVIGYKGKNIYCLEERLKGIELQVEGINTSYYTHL